MLTINIHFHTYPGNEPGEILVVAVEPVVETVADAEPVVAVEPLFETVADIELVLACRFSLVREILSVTEDSFISYSFGSKAEKY